MGRLNLWEVRAILGEPRDFTCEVLLWLAARGKITYSQMEDQLYISPARQEPRTFSGSSPAREELALAAG
jgi:hypothetical protein